MEHTLPPLPYALDALAPHINAQTLTIHHGKHHQQLRRGQCEFHSHAHEWRKFAKLSMAGERHQCRNQRTVVQHKYVIEWRHRNRDTHVGFTLCGSRIGNIQPDHDQHQCAGNACSRYQRNTRKQHLLGNPCRFHGHGFQYRRRNGSLRIQRQWSEHAERRLKYLQQRRVE